MKRYRLLLIFLHGILIASCDDSEDIAPEVSRTIIVYMATDNYLSEDAVNNIAQMERDYLETGISPGWS